jgi:hypothetical protein
MDLQEVKTYLETNSQDAAVVEYLSELKKPTAEVVNSYLDSQEGVKLLQPRLDSHFSKGLQTWKDNNLSKLIDEEVAKRNPGETPEQKEIRELKAQLEQDKAERLKEKLTNVAMKKADELGLPLDLVQHFIGADEDSTNSNLENFNSAFQTALKTQVDSKFKQNGRDVKNYGDDKQEISSIADLANEFNIRNK